MKSLAADRSNGAIEEESGQQRVISGIPRHRRSEIPRYTCNRFIRCHAIYPLVKSSSRRNSLADGFNGAIRGRIRASRFTTLENHCRRMGSIRMPSLSQCGAAIANKQPYKAFTSMNGKEQKIKK